LKRTAWGGEKRDLRVQEELLVAGDHVYALGAARREPVPATQDGHRTASTARLVLSQGDGQMGELLLTNKTEQELAKLLSGSFWFVIFLGAVGAVLAVVGLIRM